MTLSESISAAEMPIFLVLGIAHLGEANLFGWWRSRGLSEAGEYVLGGSFPRTWTLSALELAVLSATIRHEEVLKRPTAVHLFSDQLQAKRWALNWLREHKAEGIYDGFVGALRTWNRETARHELSALAGIALPAGEVVGQGFRLGALKQAELRNPVFLESVVRALAAAYLGQGEDLRFPYFDIEA